MKNIGLFEAKTKLSEICAEVIKKKEPVLITKRGKPLVRIDPIEENRVGIWDLAKKFKKTYGSIKDDFDLPIRSLDNEKNYLD